MSDKTLGVEKAAERLKKKLEVDKVSLGDYKLSEVKQKKPNTHKNSKASTEERHRVKRNKSSFYLSNVAVEALNRVYISRFSENSKITRSTLICEAIDLLYSKQNRRKTDVSSNSEQPDFSI